MERICQLREFGRNTSRDTFCVQGNSTTNPYKFLGHCGLDQAEDKSLPARRHQAFGVSVPLMTIGIPATMVIIEESTSETSAAKCLLVFHEMDQKNLVKFIVTKLLTLDFLRLDSEFCESEVLSDWIFVGQSVSKSILLGVISYRNLKLLSGVLV